ncbi:hypothetical protein EJ06DRAFT_529382 [Trichodelitschia bisporula]|uniref:Uncharacterized protein n=1 Tax=Trichodelitschia bisporula TaxID=703511 RepID=A0A6G1HZ19_9PEZI|nr:hypothetical protein EJ06DRAFT_529382 [Trichodelitschia bisporula]
MGWLLLLVLLPLFCLFGFKAGVGQPGVVFGTDRRETAWDGTGWETGWLGLDNDCVRRFWMRGL